MYPARLDWLCVGDDKTTSCVSEEMVDRNTAETPAAEDTRDDNRNTEPVLYRVDTAVDT